jgi:hypothetical protein
MLFETATCLRHMPSAPSPCCKQSAVPLLEWRYGEEKNKEEKELFCSIFSPEHNTCDKVRLGAQG